MKGKGVFCPAMANVLEHSFRPRLSDLALALVFLTRLPWPGALDATRPVGRVAWAFPLIGAALGGLAGLVWLVAASLALLSCGVAHALLVTSESALFHRQKPLHLSQLRRLIRLQKRLLWELCWTSGDQLLAICGGDGAAALDAKACAPQFLPFLLRSLSDCFCALHDRSSRRPLGGAALFALEAASGGAAHREMLRAMAACADGASGTFGLGPGRSGLLLAAAPGLVAHRSKLYLWRERVAHSRRREQAADWSGRVPPAASVSIRRGFVLEDGMRTLGALPPRAMRGRVAVSYVDGRTGERESGIDVGGLFKEFWCDLSALAFNADFGLFTAYDAPEGSFIFPNPASEAVFGVRHLDFQRFVGAVLAKSLLEGITAEHQFSHFFLSFLRGRYNPFHTGLDLQRLDPELYANLSFLRDYEAADVEDLGLTFSVTQTDGVGGNREVDLVPGGSGLAVTSANRIRYINAVAKYYVIDRVRPQASAFMDGFRGVLGTCTPALLMFTIPELQLLISGEAAFEIDVADMQRHCRYAGGYSARDPVIRRFFKVLKAMRPEQQKKLLRFVTSCSRPPPLGFEHLQPPLTIQRVSGGGGGGGLLSAFQSAQEQDRLPTASTCFNILKLPPFGSEALMRDKILTAIEDGGEGFHLS